MLHPRRFGNASFTGVACDIPSIGIAKNLLSLPEEGIDRDEQHIESVCAANIQYTLILYYIKANFCVVDQNAEKER